MTFKPGVSGNPHGNRHRTRHLLNQEFMQALLLNFRHEGKRAIEKVARNQPGVYLKILALLVPREMQIEHTNRIKQMTDEQIEQAIEAIQTMLAARAGEAVKVIEGTAEPAALPAPNGPSPEAALEANLEPTKRKPNQLMMEDRGRAEGAQAEEARTVACWHLISQCLAVTTGGLRASARGSASRATCHRRQARNITVLAAD